MVIVHPPVEFGIGKVPKGLLVVGGGVLDHHSPALAGGLDGDAVVPGQVL